MPRLINLVGHRFGKLVVTEKGGKARDGHLMWKCKCDCGKDTEKMGRNLKIGITKSCGCLVSPNDRVETEDQKQAVLKDYNDGLLVSDIAKKNNLGYVSVCNWLKKTQRESLNKRRIKPNGGSARHSILRNYIKSARDRELEFRLSEEEFYKITSMNCHYCGRVPSGIYESANKTGVFTYNGIDRRDNTKGYTLENSVPCCKICNRAKLDLPLQEFQEWVKDVSSFQIGRFQG